MNTWESVAAALLFVIATAATAQADESNSTQIIDEVIVTAPYPRHLLMDEIIVTAPYPDQLKAGAEDAAFSGQQVNDISSEVETVAASQSSMRPAVDLTLESPRSRFKPLAEFRARHRLHF